MKVKGLFLATVTSILLVFGFSNQMFASHSMGGDIYYQCVGQDSFLVTLNFYRDCAGTTAPGSATVNISSALCGLSQNLTLTPPAFIQPQGIPNGSEVSALCDQQINNSTCNGGTLPGVQQYQYTGLFVANGNCPDWVISYDLCCRNDLITTLTTPGSQDLYIEATLNNTSGICNSSPIFTNIPVPYFCYLDTIFYNHGTIDFDGDSLVYTLINPLNNSGTNIPYNAGFGITNPLTTNGSFNFNTSTGQLYFVPQQAQVGVITIRVDEYRNGVLVGSTMRDIQVVVLGQPICNPPYGVIRNNGIDSASVQGAVYIDDFELEACPGDTISFEIQFVGDSIYLGSNAALALPGATFDTSYVSFDTVRGTFTWVTTPFDTGFNVFSISYGINSCPIDRSSSQSVLINILDGTYAFPNHSTYCTDGSPIQLNAIGGNNFIWSPSAGLSSTTIRNPLASPTVTTQYIVNSDLSARCKNSDTIVVELVPNFILDIQPQLDTIDICRNSLTQLSVTTDTAWGPYTYYWTPAADLNDSTIYNPLASPDVTTQYIATVTSDTGCVIRDSIIIDITGVGPQVIATATPSDICPGDIVQLTSAVYPVTCGPAIGLGSCGPNNPAQQLTYGAGTFNEAVTPLTGQSSDGRYQVLYRASSLVAAGVPAGTIGRIQFKVGIKGSNAGYNNLRIRMGCTDETQLSRSAWLPTTTEVYSGGSVLTPAAGGNLGFNLSQRYDWDGVSNLVIEFCYGDTSFVNAGGNDLLVSSNAGYPAAMNATSTTANGGCNLPASQIPVNQPVNNIPNITFFICPASTPAYTYQWSPATGLSDATIPNPTALISSETTYTLLVTDTACDGSDFVTITIDTSTITTNADTILCNADSVKLFVNVNTSLPVTCGLNGNTCSGPTAVKTVGTGTVVNILASYPTPYGGFRQGAHFQYLYTANELIAAGVLPGKITALAFNIATLNGGSAAYTGYTIKMKCTSSSSLAVNQFETGLSTVFNTQNITVASSGWNNHVLNNAYDWDGSSNIVVDICYFNSAGTTNASVYSSNTAYQSSIYIADDANVCNGGSTIFQFSGGTNSKPNMRLTTCAAPQPYTVLWSPSSSLSNPNIVNPTAYPTTSTTYYVSVTAAGGCTKYDSVQIGIGTLPYTISNDTAICGGATVQLNVNGVNTTYSWSPDATLSCNTCPNPLATPLVPTDYVVVITDTVLGCSVLDTVSITFLGIPPVDLGPDTTLCNIDVLTFDVGTVPGYTITWNDGSNNSTYTVSAPGPDTVYVTLSSGACISSDTVIVNYYNPVLVDIGPDTNTCSGIPITFDAGPGFSNYFWSTTQGTQTISTNVGGNVWVIVTDAMGCVGVDTAVLVDISPAISLGNDTILCDGDSVFLLANSGFASYVWNVPTLTDTTVWVSTTGTYSITVTDTNNCTTVDSVKVQFNLYPVVDLGNDTTVCFGELVTFDAGNSGNIYTWNDNSSNQTIVTGAPNEYSVTVSDSIGCAASDTVNLNLYQTTPVDLGADVAQCVATDAFVLDASPDYDTYVWNNGSTADTLLVSSPGTYSVTVTDFNGCSSADSVFVLPAPSVDAGPDSVNICVDGSIQLNATGGTVFEWSPSTGLSNTQIANPVASPTVTTTYYVTGGNSTGNLVVNGDFEQGNTGFTSDYTYSPSDLTPAATYAVLADPNTAHSNFFGSDHTTGSGLFFASNGSGTSGEQVWCSSVTVLPNTNYNFSTWISTLVTGNPAQLQFTINGVPIGSNILAPNVLNQWEQFFTLWNSGNATSAVICIENLNTTTGGNDFGLDDILFETICGGQDSIVVVVNNPPAIDLGADDTICPGTVVVLDAGAGMSVYDWSNNDDTRLSTVSTGTYSVTITSAYGCVNADTITLSSYPQVNFTLNDLSICPDEVDTLFGPAGYVSYYWSDSSTNQNLVVTQAGSYSLTVTDTNGCRGVDTAVVTNVGITIDAYVDPIQINVGENATLAVFVYDGSGGYTYSWSPDSLLSNPNIEHPVTSPDSNFTFYVTVTDTVTGCSATDSVTLIVFDETAWAFPQAFSPNGDNDNDFFALMFTGDVELVEFRIYNRWGEVIFDEPIGWDGTFEGVDQPIGTYVYTAVIKVTTAAGTTTENVQGVFTLLR